MKKLLCAGAALCLALTVCGCSSGEGVGIPLQEEKTLNSAAPFSAESGAAVSGETEPSASAAEKEYAPKKELSGELRSFQLQIGDQVLAFPMTYEELTALGWTAEDENGSVRGSGRSSVWFCREGLSLGFYMYNADLEEMPCSQCQVSGVSTSFSGVSRADGVFLPGGLRLGEATEEDVLAAYSEPDTQYSINGSRYFHYTTDSFSDTLKLTLNSSGILTECEMDHPEVTESLTNSGEEYVADMGQYETPEEMTSSLRDRVVELDGQLYRLPVPVSQLIQNGWTAEEGTLAGGNIEFISLQRGDTVMNATVHNEEASECRIEDTWIQALSSADVPDGSFAVSGGITMRTTEQELRDILEREGLSWEITEENGRKRYSVPLSQRDWEDYCDVVFENGAVVYIQLAYRGKTE